MLALHARRVVSIAAVATLAAGLAACGGGGSKSTQVAVKVNKDEVTVLQLNHVMAHTAGGVAPDQVENTKRRMLGELVDQQLMVQQAVEHKLDRDPEVLAALEGARQSVLAQAYVQRVVLPQATPSEREVQDYYVANPALFAERKVYRLLEVNIEANAEQAKEIAAVAAGAKSAKQVADYLHEHKIPYVADNVVRSAEQIPLGYVNQVAQLKPGGVLVYPTGPNRLTAVEVVQADPQPVDEKRAAPFIQQYLRNHKRDDLVVAEAKRLRAAARIEYVGDFAKYAPDAVATASAPAPAAPATTATAKDEQEKGIAASLR
jgi:EpsD family peptidyl-prolyl cis-trans isomerase